MPCGEGETCRIYYAPWWWKSIFNVVWRWKKFDQYFMLFMFQHISTQLWAEKYSSAEPSIAVRETRRFHSATCKQSEHFHQRWSHPMTKFWTLSNLSISIFIFCQLIGNFVQLIGTWQCLHKADTLHLESVTLIAHKCQQRLAICQ